MLAIASGMLFAIAPCVHADDPPSAKQLTELLVKGKGPAQWSGVLDGVLLEEARDSHAVRYGAVVGPIFAQAAVTAELDPEAKRKLYAFVIDHLVETQPEGDAILLVDVFLPHLERDRELVRLLREGDLLRLDVATGRRPAWDRLQRNVVELVSAPEAGVRRAAIRLLPERELDDYADAVAALHGVLATRPEGFERADEAACLGASEALLGHRFKDVAALSAFLDPFAERFAKRAEWSELERTALDRDLRRAAQQLATSAGGADTERLGEAARMYGRVLIAKAQGPADLMVFFDPDVDPDPELQREAAQRAAGMKPVADEAWAEFLRRCLAHSTDQRVLTRVIQILGSTFREPAPPHTPLVATAVAQRLKEGAETDSVDARKNLASMLGVIGSLADLQEALPDPQRLLGGAANGRQDPVWKTLIHAVGLVDTGLVVRLALYYRFDEKLQPKWARLAVAEALGFDGIRNSETEKPLAAAMLRHILDGDEVTLGTTTIKADNREAEAAVRIAAIRSMQHYPDLGTAPVLGTIAEEQTEEGAEAVKVIGRQLRQGSVEAGNELARLIGLEADAARLDALLDLVAKETPATLDAGARSTLAAAVLGVMRREGTGEALRAKAAAASVRLADHLALGTVHDIWDAQTQEAARAQWKQLLQALFVAAAPAGKDSPAVEEALLDQLSVMKGEQHYAEALEFLDAMGENAARLGMRHVRAELRYEYASAGKDRTPQQRRGDLDAAARLFREVASETADEGIKRNILVQAYQALELRATPEYLDNEGGEKAKTFQLEALNVAVESRDPGTAREALEGIVRVLEEGADGLTDDDKAILAERKKELTAIAGG
jgi:hypothetical protein